MCNKRYNLNSDFYTIISLNPFNEVRQMYKLQFVNAKTHEVIKEQSYRSKKNILYTIENFEYNSRYFKDEAKCYIFDSEFRTLEAEYINYRETKDTKSRDFTYQLFFNVKLSEIQVPIK